MKNQLDDDKLKDKFTEDDKKVIQETTAECLQWLEGNANAEAADYEAKQKELEGKFNPIMMKVYQGAGGGGMPGAEGMGFPGAGGAGAPPTGGAPDEDIGLD